MGHGNAWAGAARPSRGTSGSVLRVRCSLTSRSRGPSRRETNARRRATPLRRPSHPHHPGPKTPPPPEGCRKVPWSRRWNRPLGLVDLSRSGNFHSVPAQGRKRRHSPADTRKVRARTHPGTPPATRVRAADSILDHTTKAIEIEGLEARLTELERAAEETARSRSGR